MGRPEVKNQSPVVPPPTLLPSPGKSLEKQSNPEEAKAWPEEKCMWLGIGGSLPECVCVYASEPRPLTLGKLTRLCVFWGLCMAT